MTAIVWNTALDNALRDYRKRGYAWKKVEHLMGISETALYNRARVLNIPTSRILIESKWTPEIDSRIKRLRDNGLTWWEVSQEIKVNVNSLRKHVRLMKGEPHDQHSHTLRLSAFPR